MTSVIVVGSGFGGAVAAYRLAKRGYKVTVFERGRQWRSDEYPRATSPIGTWLWDDGNPTERNGWFDVRFLDQMVVVQGAGVGGGSLVYANVCVDAPDAMFNTGWPSQVTAEAMRPHYAQVGEVLKPALVPELQNTARRNLLCEAASKAGVTHRFTDLPLAVDFDEAWNPEENTKEGNPGPAPGKCRHCGDCVVGCIHGAKRTLDKNYLALATQEGATIEPLRRVRRVQSLGGRWRVHWEKIGAPPAPLRTADADFVVLAAGSLGSTELLLRSQKAGTLCDLPAALGRGWSSNGDFLTVGRQPEGADLTPVRGVTISGAVDFLDGNVGGLIGSRYRGMQMYIQDGGFPDVITSMLDAWVKAAPPRSVQRRLLELARRRMGNGEFDRVMPWFAQSVDAANGTVKLGRQWRQPWKDTVRLDWDPRRSAETIDAVVAMHRMLAKKVNGEVVDSVVWRKLNMLITPHPLGGCNMAASPAAGVVDHTCQVFGHKGLYVMDGSVIPRSIGRNPSKTIAAVAERACALFPAP